LENTSRVGIDGRRIVDEDKSTLLTAPVEIPKTRSYAPSHLTGLERVKDELKPG